MKIINRFPLILSLIFALSFLYVGCEGDDDSGGDGVITKTSGIKYINGGRTQLEMDDGFTVNITPNTTVIRQRPSCSGFEIYSMSTYELSDTVEYSFVSEKADYANRTVDATTVKAYRAEYLDPNKDLQYITFVDTDKDFIVDKDDNCDLTPNTNQLDTDSDGRGDACDADPNDPNVQ